MLYTVAARGLKKWDGDDIFFFKVIENNFEYKRLLINQNEYHLEKQNY